MLNFSHPHMRIRITIAVALTASLLVPSAALGIAREDVLSRGEVWIAKKVPYSQSRYARIDGTLVPDSTSESRYGYRTDCSGFVSMCMAIETADGYPLSLDTATLPYRCDPITGTTTEQKNQRRPGDIILRPKSSTAYGHAVVFVRWVDSTKKSYIGYHESSSKGGAVAATITYPFFSESGFKPYRFKTIENQKLRRSRLWFERLPATSGASVSSLPSAETSRLLEPLPATAPTATP